MAASCGSTGVHHGTYLTALCRDTSQRRGTALQYRFLKQKSVAETIPFSYTSWEDTQVGSSFLSSVCDYRNSRHTEVLRSLQIYQVGAQSWIKPTPFGFEQQKKPVQPDTWKYRSFTRHRKQLCRASSSPQPVQLSMQYIQSNGSSNAAMSVLGWVSV